MSTTSEQTTGRRPLRLWPGVVIAALVLLLRFVLPLFAPEAMIVAVLAGPVGAIAVLIWWLFFSRAAWIERVAALVLFVGVLVATNPLLHESIATGAMGILFYVFAIPVMALGLVGWAVATRNLADRTRRVTMVVTFAAAAGAWTLVRTGGFSGGFENDLAWRWTPTPEERLLAEEPRDPAPSPSPVTTPPAPAAPVETQTPGAPTAALASTPPVDSSAPASPAAAPAVAETAAETAEAAKPAASVPIAGADWPGFRGRGRDSIVHSASKIDTDWSSKPPVQMWRRAVGPGWSSFAVRGGVFYTQEQRGEEEVVASYRVATGEPVWRHRDPARFWESNAGAGPRGTPTLAADRVYTLGATGIVNALDARSGAVIWSRNAASDTGAALPTWGFSGSPLVLDDTVVVAASGALVAYDLASGKPRWVGREDKAGYSSPQLMTVGGVPQILLLNSAGLMSVAPTDGRKLWEHAWKGYPIVQPAQTPDGDILIAVNESSGTRRLAAAPGADGWTVEERWTSNFLKPYFNDFVVHKGHAFGFDGRILACIDLKDGSRKWKGGRYGSGQLVLLPEQDLLLVLSEEGEVALVGAATDQFRELARFPAIEGKTWNHPVLVDDVLLVRNSEQMAAFKLTLANR